jgi:RNA polymerase sigma-70 factor (ECF subfamily)
MIRRRQKMLSRKRSSRLIAPFGISGATRPSTPGAKNFLASQSRRTPTSTENDAEQAESFDSGEQLRDINTPESVLASQQIARTVNAAMDALPLDLRTAIVLREIEGLSYEEIADIMACPIGTVRSRIFRARDVIAEKLRPLLDMPLDKRW